jgi:hypothetical protein
MNYENRVLSRQRIGLQHGSHLLVSQSVGAPTGAEVGQFIRPCHHRWASTVVLGLGLAAIAQAQTPTAVIFCPTCGSPPGHVSDFTIFADTYAKAYAWPFGAIILVVSEGQPYSCRVRWTVQRIGIIYLHLAVPIDTTLQACKAKDNLYFPGRHARLKQEVGIGPTYNQPVATQQAAIASEFVIQQTGFGSAHDLGNPDLPITDYWQFQQRECTFVVCNTETYTVFIGSNIWVDFGCTAGQACSGFSQQFTLENVQLISGKWVPVWLPVGPVFYKGKPITPPSTNPAKPITGFGDESGYNAWGAGGNLSMVWDATQCWGLTSITLTFDDGTSFTSFGAPSCEQP